jgi:hypothetical protein
LLLVEAVLEAVMVEAAVEVPVAKDLLAQMVVEWD